MLIVPRSLAPRLHWQQWETNAAIQLGVYCGKASFKIARVQCNFSLWLSLHVAMSWTNNSYATQDMSEMTCVHGTQVPRHHMMNSNQALPARYLIKSASSTYLITKTHPNGRHLMSASSSSFDYALVSDHGHVHGRVILNALFFYNNPYVSK